MRQDQQLLSYLARYRDWAHAADLPRLLDRHRSGSDAPRHEIPIADALSDWVGLRPADSPTSAATQEVARGAAVAGLARAPLQTIEQALQREATLPLRRGAGWRGAAQARGPRAAARHASRAAQGGHPRSPPHRSADRRRHHHGPGGPRPGRPARAPTRHRRHHRHPHAGCRPDPLADDVRRDAGAHRPQEPTQRGDRASATPAAPGTRCARPRARRPTWRSTTPLAARPAPRPERDPPTVAFRRPHVRHRVPRGRGGGHAPCTVDSQCAGQRRRGRPVG